ncbi:hypothetical protein RRG08_015862 [Elysia crispata]|uniref:Uncharacterized protein n=1 Tax=Elysia crispata TaxID=231223 RepID=A0AAE0XPE7_9GAST|nr:hypothetical protein RRG08_015862 [Elysia crispata]
MKRNVWEVERISKVSYRDQIYPAATAVPSFLRIPELGFLLDGLCGADSLVAHVSGEALLALVQNGILHFARALNMLLAAGPSVM